MIATTNLASLGGGGHTIENAAGTDLTQRDTLQFGSYLTATDDSTHSKTVVSAEPTEITYAEWSSLTPAQKAGKLFLITDMSGNNQSSFVLKNQSLTFNNLVATISDARITANTYPLIYYVNDDVAAAAGITSTTSTGSITFTAQAAPSTAVVCDIVFTYVA